MTIASRGGCQAPFRGRDAGEIIALARGFQIFGHFIGFFGQLNFSAPVDVAQDLVHHVSFGSQAGANCLTARATWVAEAR
jgi:hypothetical protein